MAIDTDTPEFFLSIAPQFKLGGLDTEGFHPLTQNLSAQAAKNMGAAVAALRAVDKLALKIFAHTHAQKLPSLARDIAETFKAGGRVFLCGCGATGRLSLALEWLCRDGLIPKAQASRVVAFMAGGDAALIRSIEAFEDHPEWGARQLEELGFGKNDLLIASTEGGETPWVIGAAERAAEISKRAPWFLYCNPDEPLCRAAERSKKILENPRVKKMNLAVGPMGVAGSTRMQSSTVLMAAIGFALRHFKDPQNAGLKARAWALREVGFAGKMGRDFMRTTARLEADAYKRGEYTLYRTDDFALSVLTDTTERSPTFSLPIFENALREGESPVCLCYLHFPKTKNAAAAWKALLKRAPRCLEWDFCKAYSGYENLLGYDFSDRVVGLRKKRVGEKKQHVFAIKGTKQAIVVKFRNWVFEIQEPGDDVLERNLLLKMLLNTHSTAVMARLGRCHGNVMTYVKPSNYKLIDRAIRYVAHLRKLEGLPALPYAKICRAIFTAKKDLKPDEPVVMKTLALLKNERISKKR